MSRFPIYQVDALADGPFSGNPAAVVPLQEWLPDATLQAIAAENNLPATAFFRGEGERRAIRWFTPTVELPLCGHGTLAAAHVILDLRARHAGDRHRTMSMSTRSRSEAAAHTISQRSARQPRQSPKFHFDDVKQLIDALARPGPG